jgi:hypothetical protein
MRDVQQKLKSPHHCIDLYFWPLVKVLASFFLLTGQFLPDFSCMDPYKNFPHARRTAPASVCPAYVVSSVQEQQQQQQLNRCVSDGWWIPSAGWQTACDKRRSWTRLSCPAAQIRWGQGKHTELEKEIEKEREMYGVGWCELLGTSGDSHSPSTAQLFLSFSLPLSIQQAKWTNKYF